MMAIGRTSRDIIENDFFSSHRAMVEISERVLKSGHLCPLLLQTPCIHHQIIGGIWGIWYRIVSTPDEIVHRSDKLA